MDMVLPSTELKPMMPSASTQCANQFISKPSGLCPIHFDQNGILVPHSSKLTPNNPDINPTSSFLGQNSSSNGQFDSIATHSFLILEQNTFEVLQSIQFPVNEFGLSIISTCFESDPGTAYYIVGTCAMVDDDPEPKIGRLIVFKYSENKMVQVCEKELKGAPYCLSSYNGKLLVGVSNSLKLFDFKDNQLNLISSYSDNVFVIHLKCKNDFILIGDLMKSCSVLTFRPDTNVFEMVAKDFTPIWLNCLEIIDDDNFLMCDSFQNVISLRKDG
jgi:DNA damage-binding protein 1